MVASTSESQASGDGLVEGAKVKARFAGRGKHYPGTIEAVNADGTFAIRYDDGDKEAKAKREHVRLVDAPSTPAPAVGAKVEAQFHGKGTFVPGTIEAVNADGTFAILYEDGDKEADAKREHVKFLDAPRLDAASSPAGGGAAAASTDLVKLPPGEPGESAIEQLRAERDAAAQRAELAAIAAEVARAAAAESAAIERERAATARFVEARQEYERRVLQLQNEVEEAAAIAQQQQQRAHSLPPGLATPGASPTAAAAEPSIATSSAGPTPAPTSTAGLTPAPTSTAGLTPAPMSTASEIPVSREPSSFARSSVETDALCGESSSDDPQSRLDEHFKGLDSPDVKFHSYKSLL